MEQTRKRRRRIESSTSIRTNGGFLDSRARSRPPCNTRTVFLPCGDQSDGSAFLCEMYLGAAWGSGMARRCTRWKKRWSYCPMVSSVSWKSEDAAESGRAVSRSVANSASCSRIPGRYLNCGEPGPWPNRNFSIVGPSLTFSYCSIGYGNCLTGSRESGPRNGCHCIIHARLGKAWPFIKNCHACHPTQGRREHRPLGQYYCHRC